ncbi:MAG: TIGR01777 family protein [Candidatus Hydrogenedentes bacterium]|nr:TIGR01777 family protein [Candidatus Hydrogenedentota bacterium]
MKVLVTGSTGLIGSAVVDRLKGEGHEVCRLVRGTRGFREQEINWDPDADLIDAERLEGLDGVVHLAGENISSRWDAEKKRRIRESRVKGTALLCHALAGLSRRPQVLVSASAIGYYGSRGDQVMTEDARAGEGFLAEVCQGWEEATAPARAAGIRVVNLRIGVVLSGEGGALDKMLPPFRLGLGGQVGDGKQYMSWISQRDLVRAVEFCLTNETMAGPVNATSPNAVTNHEFTKTLGHVLSRPTVIPVPAVLLRGLFGEMADEMLLASTRCAPQRLEAAGFTFEDADLEATLREAVA